MIIKGKIITLLKIRKRCVKFENNVQPYVSADAVQLTVAFDLLKAGRKSELRLLCTVHNKLNNSTTTSTTEHR